MDFSKQPKKVSSKILPRGPFHMEGRILGPSGHRKYGKYEIAEHQVRGIFEVCSDSGEEKEVPSDSTPSSQAPQYINKERGEWVSKKDIDKVKDKEEERIESQIKEVNYCMTEEELENRQKYHNKSNCKYCGLIHYVLAKSEGSNCNDKLKRNISPDRKTDRPTTALRKEYNMKQHGEVKDSQRQVQGKNTTNVERYRHEPHVNKNKNDISTGYWHQQFLENRNAHKNIELDRCCHHRCLSPSVLSREVNTSGNSSPLREQRPRQFTVAADVHQEDTSVILSPGSKSTRPTSTPMSTPVRSTHRPHTFAAYVNGSPPGSPAMNRRDNGPVLNLAAPSQQNSHRRNDSYFETRIPITLKDFQGELKTEVEVHKKNRREESKSKREESKSPLVTVATKVKIFKI